MRCILGGLIDKVLAIQKIIRKDVVSSSQIQQLRGVAPEAAPCGVIGNLLIHGSAQVALNALLAEYVDAFRAAEDDSALAAPAAEELAAILATLKLAAVVELEAGLAHGHFQDIVKSDLGHSRQGETQMLEAGRAVVLQLCHRVHIRVDLVVFLKILNGRFIVDQVLWKKDMR